MCKEAELTFLQSFADTRASMLWLPPVIPGKADGLTTRLTVGVDLFLAELMRTLLEISCEVQHVDILCFFLNLVLSQCLPNQWELEHLH